MYVRRQSVRTIAIIAAAVAAVVAVLAVIVYFTVRKADRELAAPPAPPKPVIPVALTKKQIAALPRATTYGKLSEASVDTAPTSGGDGRILHPTAAKVVYAEPGGPPIAVLPVKQLGNPTWVPVIETRPEWTRVLLPTRPNGATGWIHTGGGGVKQDRSPYQVRVNLTQRRLTLLKDGHETGSWPVAIGAPATPTPVGRTFLLASLTPPEVTYSPLILPLGSHSEKLETYEGGPGTIGLHGWPDDSTFGKAVSHGCVRLPKPALNAVSRTPLGTMIVITK
ncbi:L,D-transpeptidase [Sphaerisporangium sp. TRM90804]|uniref:L,D-transpeptidase n=1 Tax=Sphaerisporangium sp. TRM90804 TaxID=3031113 RepID=UPI0024476B39|nr:L,D-transpeptidase [Sphaerisporangium sp. TRM90804]MDH2427759.1 L,D-transpeptidase [Sphaerisporangium sp. TRM90804]